ncbi:ubiquitin-conjugating enzyme E2 K [Sparganum proliferum]
MRQARDRQRESIALSGSNPGKSVANIFHHRSSSKRGHELPPLLNDNKVFLTDDTDKAELFSAFFAKHLATESEPVTFFRSLSDMTLSTIDVSSDLIKKHIKMSAGEHQFWVLEDSKLAFVSIFRINTGSNLPLIDTLTPRDRSYATRNSSMVIPPPLYTTSRSSLFFASKYAFLWNNLPPEISALSVFLASERIIQNSVERGASCLTAAYPIYYSSVIPVKEDVKKAPISATGVICLDILKDQWAAAMSLRTMLLSIQALLASPEPDDPQDAVVASQFKSNRAIFNLTARHWASVYANGPSKQKDCEEKVEKLIQLGFSETEARAALSMKNWDIPMAAEHLLK